MKEYIQYKEFVAKTLVATRGSADEELVNVITQAIVKKAFIDLSLKLPENDRSEFLSKAVDLSSESDILSNYFSSDETETVFQEAAIFILNSYFDESGPLTEEQKENLAAIF